MTVDAAKPPLVYLDSQDFSRFSPSHAEYEKYRAVMRDLLVLKEQGLARFAFSDIHIFESLPANRSAFKPALERMRTIGMICGSNNLPSFFDFMKFELRCMVADVLGRPRPKAPPSDWFPDLPFPEPSRARYKDAVKELVEPRLNRQVRRHLERTLSKRTANPVSMALAETSVTELMARYPFMEADRASIIAYYRGSGSWAMVHNAVKNGLRNIVGFSDWLLDNWEHGERLVRALRDQAKPFHETMLKLQMELASATLRGWGEDANDQARRHVSQLVAEEWAKFQLTFPRRLAHRFLGELSNDAEFHFTERVTPSLMTAWQFLFEVVSRATMSKNARKPKESDFADALHAFFVPQVDIFRSDRFACDVLGHIPSAKRVIRVSSLSDLPGVIQGWNARLGDKR